ncbi:MAG: hypothetical protein GY835_09830 [bacterium]|nr:hypothetical protein [bacterium]
MRTTLLPIALLLGGVLGCIGDAGATVSLFPLQDPAEQLAEVEFASCGRSASAAYWQPYGLSGVMIQDVGLGWRVRKVDIGFGYSQQDWGVIRAQGGRLRLVGGSKSGVRLGFTAALASIEGGASERSLDLLASGGGKLRLAICYRLWESPAPSPGSLAAPGLLGLSWGRESWTLGIFRTLGAEEVGEGVSLSWEEGPIRLRALSGSGPWQGVELALRRGRLVLSLRARMHAWLGISRGVSLLVN